MKESNTGIYREIAPNVYFIEAGKGINRSNVYFVRSGASWVLIDAASVNCGRSIRKTAETLFGANTRPVSILLTHDHPDHAGSARELARIWKCPVYVHPDELPLATIEDLATVKKYANPLDRWIILPIFHLMPRRKVESLLSKDNLKGIVLGFDPKAGVPGLPDWEYVFTPGHTPGHVAFFRSGDGILLTGDAVVTADLNSISGMFLWSLRKNRQRVSGPPWYSTWDKKAAIESVAVLARLSPHVLGSGHGIPMTGDLVSAELRALAERLSGARAR